MKIALFSLIFFSLCFALGEESSSQPVMIISARGRKYEISQSPNSEQMKAGLGLLVPEEIKKQMRAEGREVPEIDPLLPFKSLKESDRVEFQKRRKFFLEYLAIACVRSRFLFGTGLVLKDSFAFVREKWTGQGQPERPAFGDRINLAIQALLQSVDYKLWFQAPLLVRANEFGVSIALGPSAITGVRHSGVGGAEEIGISFAVNIDKKAGVFEFYHNSEKYSHSMAGLSVLGLQGKLGLSIRSVNNRRPMNPQMGESFYPPAFPGFQTLSSDWYVSGLSSAWGLPPPPFADMLTVTTKFEKTPWLRITVSPVVRGYIRLYFGRVDRSMLLISSRFKGMYELILSKFGYGRCEAVFAIQ